MDERKALIKFDNVSYTYEKTDSQDDFVQRSIHYAVSDVSFEVYEGEFVALIGRNGSGKSTAARMMNALILPKKGVVMVDGIDTADESRIWEIRSTVGMVFQNPDNQIIGTSVEEDVAFGPENLGIERNEMLRRIDWALETVALSDIRKFEPHLLSGGQKQRVAIAGILAMQPKCIVLDEATAMLDPSGRREVIDIVRRLNKEKNITVVLITHHMDEVAGADRVILIDDGSVVMQGTPREIFSRTEEICSCGLEVPQVTQLCELLREGGVSMPGDIITVDEATLVLTELIRKRCGF